MPLASLNLQHPAQKINTRQPEQTEEKLTVGLLSLLFLFLRIYYTLPRAAKTTSGKNTTEAGSKAVSSSSNCGHSYLALGL